MIRRCYISFWVPGADRDRCYRLLKGVDCVEGWHEANPVLPRSNPGFEHIFDDDDTHLGALLHMLRAEGIDWIERREHLYSDSELKQFPIVRISTRRASISGGGPEYGTKYDVKHACARCGTGAIQVSPLMLPSAGLPKNGLLCETHQGHALVAKPLVEAFRRAEVSGLDLRRVRSLHNGTQLNWWQMLSSYTMPRMSKQTKGIVRDTDPGWGCPVCERDMYAMTMAVPAEIAYDRDRVDPDALPDVVQTWECFGRSLLHDDPERNLARGFAQPLLLMKIRVFEIFRELKVRHAEFEPVRIVG